MGYNATGNTYNRKYLGMKNCFFNKVRMSQDRANRGCQDLSEKKPRSHARSQPDNKWNIIHGFDFEAHTENKPKNENKYQRMNKSPENPKQ